MNSLLVCTRALHFVAVLMMFGGLVLALVVVGPATQAAEPAALAVRERVGKFLRATGWWGLGLSLLSGAAWLLLEAALMSGHPIDEALSSGALQLILARTAFGRVWAWRFGLAIALGVLMFRPAMGAGDRRTSKSAWVAIALAGSYLASLALVGHSASGLRADHYLQTAADAVHLVAAGAWFGALPGLAVVFATATRESSAAALGVAAGAGRRFSSVGIASVGALLASGLVNAWYLVGDVPALFGTRYGQLLVAKIMLFATMVSLAAINRRRLTPLAERGNGSALWLLTRNTVLEFAMGIAVVAIVGALGVAIPAVHQSPVWPLGFTLSLAQVGRSVPARWILGACIATICLIALILALARARRMRIGPQTAVAYAAVVAAAVLVATWLLAVPAYPTSYATPPVKYTAMAIVGGGASYNANCVQCHGPHGRGDGPLAAALPIKPVDLVDHAAHHRPGDLFWWIAHGIRDTPMPAFSPRLGRCGNLEAGSIPARASGLPDRPSLDKPRAARSGDHGPRLCVRRSAAHPEHVMAASRTRSTPGVRYIAPIAAATARNRSPTDGVREGRDSSHLDGDEPRRAPGGRTRNAGRAPIGTRGFRRDGNVRDVRMRGGDSLRIAISACRMAD